MVKSQILELIIVGAGPAGLGAAYAAKKQGFSYRVLEAGKIVNTVHEFPLNKTLFSQPEELELEKGSFLCLNKHPTREETIVYYTNFARENQLEIETYNQVVDITKQGDLFEVHSEKSIYLCRYVIVCIGVNTIPRRLGVPGEDLSKVSHRFWKVDPYRYKKILVVGGGDSALETALSLCQVEAEVSLSYRRARFVRPQKINLLPFLERVEGGLIKVLFETVVKEIRLKSVILQKKSESRREEELLNDFVLLMTGTKPALDFLSRIGIEIRGRYPVYDEETFETRISGLYLAGHITKQRFIKNALGHGPKIIEQLPSYA